MPYTDPEAIRAAFDAARQAGRRAKEAAESIGLSEGAAVAAHRGAHGHAPKARGLRGPWIELLQALEPCGPLMGLTRNESTVHEKTGVYQRLSANGQIGLALGEDIDLRLFFQHWHAGLAVTELAANPGNRASVSLQFFDAHGRAVHKIYPREATDRDAFAAVVERFAAPDDEPIAFTPAPPALPPAADASIDAASLGKSWAAMRDTHDFFGLLRQFGVERQQSFRLMEGRFTRRAAHGTLRELLEQASFEGVPIMVFVGSPGCIQIHSGPVRRVEPMDIRGVPWLNVIDPGFNLHLREDAIAQTWLVEKPTADGVVTSIEAFDHSGGLMAMFFGARKPGTPERGDWRELAQRVAVAEVAS